MLWTDRSLVTFATCLFLFQMANAFNTAADGGMSHHVGRYSSLSMSVLVIVPQILVVLVAPWIGRQAQNWGRRPLLLVRFGALPVRALLLTLTTDPALVVAAPANHTISRKPNAGTECSSEPERSRAPIVRAAVGGGRPKPPRRSHSEQGVCRDF